MSRANHEVRVAVKEQRRAPQEEKVKLGNRLKQQLSKKKRGEYKIRVTVRRKGSVECWIWNHYRDEDAAKGALKTLGLKYSFYFLEILDPANAVVCDNKEAYDAYKEREAAHRRRDGLE